MQMAKNKKVWPTIKLPRQRGEITITHVLKAPAGEDRDVMIKTWCVSVWEAYSDSHETIRTLLQSYFPESSTHGHD